MAKSVKETDKKYVMNTYNRYDLEIVEGMGCNCYDVDGKEYLDLSSGIGVNSLGFCDMGWVDSVTQQVCKLNHTSNLYYSQPCALLAEKLCKRTGYDKVFFCNSGAEANEGAIKIARKYSFDKYGRGRDKIITLVNSFHGRTVTTLAATGQEVFHNYFFPFTEGFAYAKANDIESVKNLMDGSVCAVMAEMVQGEGGVIALDKDFVIQLKELCDKNDILFIADEVQTGIGRTGELLASSHYGILPDITTLAKGLGGGLPIGAVLANEKCSGVLGFSMHGTTFGGNPIVCAGANYVIDTIDDAFLKDVREKARYFREKLVELPEVESVSGLGLMIGLKLKNQIASEVVKEGIKKGLIMLTAKDKVRLLPPLVISYNDIDKAMSILTKLLA